MKYDELVNRLGDCLGYGPTDLAGEAATAIEELQAKVTEDADHIEMITEEIRYQRKLNETLRQQLEASQKDAERVPAEPTQDMIKEGAHVASEWLDDMAPLNERRYLEPAAAVYRAMVRISKEAP